MPIKQGMVWISTFILVGLLLFLGMPQIAHYEIHTEVLVLLSLLLGLSVPVFLHVRKNYKQRKEYMLLYATVYMVFLPLVAQKILLWLFLLQVDFVGMLTLSLLIIMLLLLKYCN